MQRPSQRALVSRPRSYGFGFFPRRAKALILAVGWIVAAGAVVVQPAAGQAPTPPPEVLVNATPKNLGDLRTMEEQIRRVTDEAMTYTVAVLMGASQGSGVVVSADGYVLTAAHVFGAPGRDVRIVFADGRSVRGKTLGLNRAADAGMVKISEPGPWPHVKLGESAAIKPGQWCLAMGHPGGVESGRKPVLRLGRVLSNGKDLIATDCTLISGDSGGPLLDLSGNLIGIHSRIAGPLTANMHVPVDLYRESWDRLVKGESWGLLPGSGPMIGVVGEPGAAEARIKQVYPDSPAAKAGIKEGDVIVRFAGERVTDFQSLSELVQQQQPGKRVKVQVRRDGVQLELELVVGRREG